jgi:Flp pilus assembly protein TadD
MKIRVTLLLLFLFMGACSSSDKKTTDDAGDSADTKGSSSIAKGDVEKDSTKKFKEEPVRNTAALYADLKASLMTKDDLSVEKSTAQILSGDANDGKALNALAMYHAQKGRFSLAEFILDKAEKIEGNSHVAYNNLGVINFQQDKKREGIGFFKKALAAKPSYGLAAANIGSYFAEVKDYSKAKISLEMAFRSGLKDLSTLNNYAISLMVAGDSADEIFEQGMQIGSTNVNFLVNYCIYLVEVKKDLGKAKSILEKINFIGADSDRREVVKNLDKKINGTQSK